MAAISHYLALVFGCLFVLAGLVKLIPLDPEQQGHGLPDMAKDFVSFYEVLPFRDALQGFIKTPTAYMSLIGIVELLFGALLAFGRPVYRVLAVYILLPIMVGAVYTLYAVGEPVAMMVPASVFGSALVYILMDSRGLSGYATSKSKTS